MKFRKMKSNTIYNAFFSSFFKFSLILTIIVFLVFYFVISYMVSYIFSLQSISDVESKSNNISFIFQEDVNLCRTLADNDTLVQNLFLFRNGDISKQIDTEILLHNLFESYWYSHNEIDNIRIFLPENHSSVSIGFSSIRHLSAYAETDWIKHFNPDNPIEIVTEYTVDNKLPPNTLYNSDCIAIIAPIIGDNSILLGYLCMDISKNALFKNMSNSAISFTEPIFVYDKNGSNIWESLAFSDNDLVPVSKYLNSSSAGYSTIYYNSEKYLLVYSATTAYGWKLFQLFPHGRATIINAILAAGSLIILMLLCGLSLYYSKKKSLKLSKPLEILSDAMSYAEPLAVDESLSEEIKNVYQIYNHLLDNNKQLIKETEYMAKTQQKTETKMLLAQISPHFLYNTLNSIAWEAVNTNQPSICSSISKLAKLFKISYSFDSEYTTLQNELNHIQLYMELQKECFKDKFSYTISVPDIIANIEIPRFILQPLIENSILHGFSQIDRYGQITITADADDNLTIVVSDNGSGIEADILKKLNSNKYFSEKYGIQNINQRIKLLCGEEYGLYFSSNSYNKTSVTITLPIDMITDTGNERI